MPQIITHICLQSASALSSNIRLAFRGADPRSGRPAIGRERTFAQRVGQGCHPFLGLGGFIEGRAKARSWAKSVIE